MIDEKTGKPIVYLVTEMNEEDGRKLPMEEKYAIIDRKLANRPDLIEPAKIILKASNTGEWEGGEDAWLHMWEPYDDKGNCIAEDLYNCYFLKECVDETRMGTSINYKWFLWNLAGFAEPKAAK